MKIPQVMLRLLEKTLIPWAQNRNPDCVIGGSLNPYLLRWWFTPRNRWFNIYVHQILRSDPTEFLHDHEYANLSIILRGAYCEQTFNNATRWFFQGAFVFRVSGKDAHRLILDDVAEPCWSLFMTGPRYRDWGFYLPQGWVSWREALEIIEALCDRK